MSYDCKLSLYCGKKQFNKDLVMELNGKAVSKDDLQNFRVIKSTLCHKMKNATYSVVFITGDSCSPGWKNPEISILPKEFRSGCSSGEACEVA